MQPQRPPSGNSNDPFSQFMPFQSTAGAAAQPMNASMAAPRPQHAPTGAPAQKPDLFNSIARNAGTTSSTPSPHPSYTPATYGRPSPTTSTAPWKPAATPASRSSTTTPAPVKSNSTDAFASLVGDMHIHSKQPSPSASHAASPLSHTPTMAAGSSTAQTWDFGIFETSSGSSAATTASPATQSPTVGSKGTIFDDDPFGIVGNVASAPAPVSTAPAVPSATASVAGVHADVLNLVPSAPLAHTPIDDLDDFFRGGPAPTAAPAAPSTSVPLAETTPSPVPARTPSPSVPEKTPSPAPQPQAAPRSPDVSSVSRVDETPALPPRSSSGTALPARQQPSGKEHHQQQQQQQQQQSRSTGASVTSMFGKLASKAKGAISEAKIALDRRLQEEKEARVPAHLISQLVEMGFKADDARVALARTDNNVRDAIDILGGQEDSAPAMPASRPVSANVSSASLDSPSANSRQEAVDSRQADVARLVDMGFTVADAKAALDYTKGDVNRAADALLAHRAKQEARRSAAAKAPSANAAPAPRQPDPRPKQERSAAPVQQRQEPPRSTSQSPKISAAPTSPPLPADVEQRVTEHKNRGNELFKAGNYDAALEQYTTAIKGVPAGHSALIPLLNNRAVCYLKANIYKPCIADCMSVLEMSPSDTKALLRRAQAYEATESLDLALADFRSVSSLSPGDRMAVDGVQRIQKALVLLEKARENERNAPAAPVIDETHDALFGSQTEATPSAPAPRRVNVHEMTLEDIVGDVTSMSADTSATGAAEPAGIDPNFKSEGLERLREREAAAKQEEAEKDAVSDDVEARLSAWRLRKEGNIRALLSSLDMILWPELSWANVGLHELVQPSQVKMKYMKAVNKVHPDKMSNATVEQKLLASGVFYTLNMAYDAFRAQNGL